MKLSIVHPSDPWNQGLGGFDTCIDGVLRHAPSSWDIEVIGVTADPRACPPGQWIRREFNGRLVRFFAALEEREPDKVKFLPLSLRFVVACRLRRVAPSGQVVQFHRFESSLGCQLKRWQRAVYFLHNHPEEVVSEFSDLRWKRLGWLFRMILGWRFRQASWVVAVDPRTPDWAALEFPWLSGRATSLPQWADLEVFSAGTPDERVGVRSQIRDSLGVAPDARLIGFVGRIERQKDPLILVGAFAEVAGYDPTAALVVVGDGRLKKSMQLRSVALDVANRVHFVAPVKRAQLADYYRAFDVVACSSGFEAGPRVVFEALACGTPVVSFDVGQVRRLLGGGQKSWVGEVVSERNSDEMALALLRSLRHPTAEDRVLACVNAVRDYTPARALGPLFDLYQSWSRDSGARSSQAPLVQDDQGVQQSSSGTHHDHQGAVGGAKGTREHK